MDLLAACHHTYAGALQPDHNDLAKDHYLKAIALRQRPELLALPRMPYRLSQTVVNLGVIQWQEHAYVEAENSFRKGEELLKIARTSPVDSSREPLFSLGHLNVNWVGMLWEQQKYDQAVARANGAIDLIESYVRKEPNDALAHDICLKLHGNRGHVRSRRKENTRSQRRIGPGSWSSRASRRRQAIASCWPSSCCKLAIWSEPLPKQSEPWGRPGSVPASSTTSAASFPWPPLPQIPTSLPVAKCARGGVESYVAQARGR